MSLPVRLNRTSGALNASKATGEDAAAVTPMSSNGDFVQQPIMQLSHLLIGVGGASFVEKTSAIRGPFANFFCLLGLITKSASF